MVSPAAAKDTNNNNNNNNEETDVDKIPVVACEISPLVSYAGEGLDPAYRQRTVQYPVCISELVVE
jgi:hypothetical protein